MFDASEKTIVHTGDVLETFGITEEFFRKVNNLIMESTNSETLLFELKDKVATNPGELAFAMYAYGKYSTLIDVLVMPDQVAQQLSLLYDKIDNVSSIPKTEHDKMSCAESCECCKSVAMPPISLNDCAFA
jgi:hypothetical protein